MRDVSKAVSWNEIRRRCAQFVSDWKDEPGQERQQAQSFVRELLQAFGITARKAAAWEQRARRSSTGGQGYIDALIPGTALVEMKSRGSDLVAAEQQAIDYLDSLNEAEMPRWVITSDFANLRVLDLLGVEGEDVEQFALEEL
ncbi:MAG TPA: type IIL restriction-modification enzyme MmeI, partial [Beutenbergiaceae bacterium]|nr:type IIL restriction-modification enzyme MmeI [Beutenbergiaceae bacterium]